MKKLMSILVVIFAPIFGVWIGFARDLPLDLPLWVGLPVAFGVGGSVSWIFYKCAMNLTGKGKRE